MAKRKKSAAKPVPTAISTTEQAYLNHAADSRPGSTARLIEAFLESVSKYWRCQQLFDLNAMTGKHRAATDQAFGSEMVTLQVRIIDAAIAVRDTGNELAARLDAEQLDPTGVLFVVHCADGGGGPHAVASKWAEIKVSLRSLLLRLGRNSIGHQSGNPNTATHPANSGGTEPNTGATSATAGKGPVHETIKRAIEIVAANPDGIVGPKIVLALKTKFDIEITYQYFRDRIAPKLLSDHGILNKRGGVGYYIAKKTNE